ncbi:thioredoxin family protein [Colwellia sp. MEBiC06753]
MKNIIKIFSVLTLTFTLLACSTTAESTGQQASIAVGDINQTQLLAEYPSFLAEFSSFQETPEQIAMVEQFPNNLTLDIYFGTWCHDSQREVPRLLKALAHNQKVAVNLVALDGHKQEPLGREKIADIKYTPTIVVKIDGREVGRIIERPATDLITDITQFIKS